LLSNQKDNTLYKI